jgi:uncharacterized protein (DUF4415 family)
MQWTTIGKFRNLNFQELTMTQTKTTAIGKNTESPLKKRRVSLSNPLSPGARLLPMKSAGLPSGMQEADVSLSFSANEVKTSALSQREQLLQPKADGMVRVSFKDLHKIGDPDFDWSRFDALTEEDIRKAVADDPDAAPIDMDWSDAVILDLMPKTAISFRVDADVYDFFKSKGKGFQTRMNAVLRAYVEHQRKLK